MAIGHILRNARIAKQLTASQVAEATRMKVQIVQDLENDDFHRIAATIYGKGFIKLYAECVGLDPHPLIQDYLSTIADDPQQPITKGVHMKRPSAPAAPTNDNVPNHPSDQTDENISVDDEADSDDDLFAFSRRKNTIEDESVKPTGEEAYSHDDNKNSALQLLKKRIIETTETLSKQASRIFTKITDTHWGDNPLKIAAGIVAVLIIILIIIIVARGCGSSIISPDTDSQLTTPAPPPAPYFD